MKVKKSIAISDSGFLFDPENGNSFSMNDTGKKILEKLKNGKEEQEITLEIMEDYEIDKETFERYFIDFVGMLKQYKIVENE